MAFDKSGDRHPATAPPRFHNGLIRNGTEPQARGITLFLLRSYGFLKG